MTSQPHVNTFDTLNHKEASANPMWRLTSKYIQCYPLWWLWNANPNIPCWTLAFHEKHISIWAQKPNNAHNWPHHLCAVGLASSATISRAPQEQHCPDLNTPEDGYSQMTHWHRGVPQVLHRQCISYGHIDTYSVLKKANCAHRCGDSGMRKIIQARDKTQVHVVQCLQS
jgi:hypothetical protein